MSRVIYKYPIDLDNPYYFTVALPQEALIVDVAAQEGRPYFWALVDTTKALMEMRFRVYVTGEKISSHHGYVGTFRIQELVFHLFCAART